MLWTWLARWTCSAWFAWRARRARRSWGLRINVLRGAFLLISNDHCTGFARNHRLILWHARLARWPCWARLIRVTGRSRLTGLLPRWSGLSALTWRTLLALRFCKRGINIAVYVPRFVIVVTAVV